MILRTVILSVCVVLGVRAQENAATSVSKSLIECYNKTENLDRELRPPATVNVLLDLIRRIESGPSIQNDREFSIEIIHRFKQDGIIRTWASGSSKHTIPYSPKGMQSDKHRLLLRRFIPGDAARFPNETLTDQQRCSLHFMLSNSVDVRKRDDESTVCNRLGRYQRRTRRGTNPNNDVEIFDPQSSPLKGNLEEGEMEEEPENPEDQVDAAFQAPDTSRKNVPFEVSDCPVENGVMYTRWGTVTPGTVISAIAAGRAQQKIRSKEDYVSDNRFATTLAGDLAEAGLHQEAAGKDSIVLGIQGDWNNTQSPRWYFIKSILNWEMTAAEIRGGLDGLIIAKNIASWKEKFPLLKLSQILDMYYSPKGVFSKKYRACNRQELFTEVASKQDLLQETIAFSLLLDDEAKLPGSISVEGIKAASGKVVDALINYIPSNLHDLKCGVEKDTVQRANTDMIIVLDTQWDYNFIQRTLSYLLDNLDVYGHGSNYTVINAKTGGVMLNTTDSILDFYVNYTRKDHYGGPTGFDASQAFASIERIVRNKMDSDSISQRPGGNSTIALFVLYNILTDSDKSVSNSMKENFRTSLPDLKVLALGRGSKEAYTDLVTDVTYDAFGISESTDGASITNAVDPVIDRVKEIPRRIINPNCGSGFSGGSGSFTLEQFIEAGTINYYKISPHYYFGEGSRTVEIQGYGYGTLAACSSRQNAKPNQNFTQGDVSCQTINANDKVTFTLTNYCDSYDQASQCPPTYISVQSVVSGSESTNIRCNDPGCRFPDDVKYTIKTDGFGCHSGALRILSNIFILIAMFLTTSFAF